MSDEKKQLSKARQALVDRVLSRLDAGAMLWDNGMQGVNAMPLNAVSGARYHGMNALNLMLTFKQDPRWLTFNQAKDNGYTVKKGAKGVPIEIYKTIDKRTGKDADMPAILEEVKDMTFTERQAFKKENLQTFARNYYVFNASDVIGIEPYRAPVLTPVAVSARNERIERVIEDSQCPIRYDGNGRNYYSPSSDEIHLTERAAFKSDEFFYNTALHEMAHSTGHNSRLNRKSGTFGSKSYAREELVAEIASVLIAAELGLTQSDRVIENSAEYVRSWAKDIRENPQTLIDAVIDASKATDYICDRERKREQTQERTQKESLQSNVNEWYSRQYPIDEFTNAINDHITFGDVRDAILTGNDIYSLLGVEDDTVRERVFGRLADLLDLSNKAVYNSWIENSESAETRREREIQAAMQDFPKEFADKKLLDAADAFARHTPKYSDTPDRAQSKSPPKQQQFTEHKKPLMINFYAGPSSGKTTAALELTAALKKAGYNVEYVSEYAKELVLENRVAELNDQKHITDEQYKRFDRIRNSADIIVTDSPILLGLVYGDGKIDDKYAKQIRSYYDSFDNFNMLMTRPKDAAFQSEGRVHDEKQSIELDGKMKSMLDTQGVFYGSYKRDDIAKTVERIGQTYARLYGEQIGKTQKESNAATPPAPPQKPYTFKTNLDNIPDAMKALPNWIAFRTHEVYDEKDKEWKLKKVPITPNQPRAVSSSQYLKWADHSDPNTWSSFDNAVSFAKRWKLDGLAFAVQNSGMTCVDLDHHLINGKPSELAQKFIDAAGTTYVEKSVSGTGLHIFYAGQIPPGIKNVDKGIDLEAYDKVRFMSMTGNLYGNATKEILPPSDAMTGLLKDNLKRVEQHTVLPSKSLGLSDNELIELIRSKSSAHDLRDFEAMWRGEDICGNRNVTDIKLCGMLAFYSNGDVAQVERCFKASGLYRPPPEKSVGYVHRTAQKACDGRRAEYDPKAYAQRMNPNRTFTKPNNKPSGSGGNGSSGR